MKNAPQILIEKTTALVASLGWDRLVGMTTRSALVEIRDSYAKLKSHAKAQSLAAEVNKMVAMADKHGIA